MKKYPPQKFICLALILPLSFLVTSNSFAQKLDRAGLNLRFKTQENVEISNDHVNSKIQRIQAGNQLTFLDAEAEKSPSPESALNENRKLEIEHPNPINIEKSAEFDSSEISENDQGESRKYLAKTPIEQKDEKEKFHWKPALIQSGIFLGIQQIARLKQEKTRNEFKGKFFADWSRSVRNLQGWEDGDNSFTNYVAHPLQGGVTGRIFVNNSDKAKKQEFGKSKEYWNSRVKAMIWSAAWSTQFELGPVSEATIGNVGLWKKNGRSTMACIDLVVTPTVGTGVVIGEDAIDKYILKNWVERNKNKATIKVKLLRSILTPTTGFTNLLRGKMPWYREMRAN